MEEVFGGVYFGVVVVGSSLGAEPEPNDQEPWNTPVLAPVNFLKRPYVISRPLAPQPGHCEGSVKVGNYLNERQYSPHLQ